MKFCNNEIFQVHSTIQILLMIKISLVTKPIPTHSVAGILRLNFLNVYLIKLKKKDVK